MKQFGDLTLQAAAARAGFSQPILHGLCSMGIATRALIETVADGDPDRLRAVSLRSTKPVIPGEILRVEIHRTHSRVQFRARALERNIVVLDRGHATLTG
jgi:acyl dehydratase